MSLYQYVKKNKMLTAVIAAYLVVTVLSPDKALASAKNSLYYLKEMLTVMPIIFVLTSLIETWVPRQIIIENLGDKSGTKGVVLSFALGSLSAGPIYAAFPICKALLAKGASVLNIVIILSSWAVIKVPMLINEVKFLGFNYMLVRWILTTVSILLIAAATSLILKGSIPQSSSDASPGSIKVLSEYCISCGLCVDACAKYFTVQNGKVTLTSAPPAAADLANIKEIAEKCPAQAIILQDAT